jgi:hypothetical protein
MATSPLAVTLSSPFHKAEWGDSNTAELYDHEVDIHEFTNLDFERDPA